MTRRWLALAGVTTIVVAALAGTLLIGEQQETPPAYAALQGEQATLYMSPHCGCCGGYAEALEQHGLEVEVIKTGDMQQIKLDHSVPAEAQSCHTTLVGGYVVEGHVPLETLAALLSDKPDIDGIALPGMPTGTPGMPGPKQRLDIVALEQGSARPYRVVAGE